MARYVWMVSAAAKPGREAEFNQFYDRQHVPDVLKSPGFVSCRRLRALEEPPLAGHYVALYEIESDNPKASIRQLYRLLGTEAMPPNPATDRAQTRVTLYELILEKQSA
jgi:hypothetical protein